MHIPSPRRSVAGAADRAARLPKPPMFLRPRNTSFSAAPGQGMNQQVPETLGRSNFEEILAQLPNAPSARIQTGLSYIFSPLRSSPETTVRALAVFLEAAEQTATPVLVQIDLEHWWEARPNLWNWWDPAKLGYNPANRENVEWIGWSTDGAVKIAWRNWGHQLRIDPPPNLASPRYMAACREEIRRLVPVVLDWHARLPAEKKHLLVGIKLGHETSIGVNAYYFPGGNNLLAKPATDDPKPPFKTDDVPARGMVPLGFAALKTSGIRASRYAAHRSGTGHRSSSLSRDTLRRSCEARRATRTALRAWRRLEGSRTILRRADEPPRLSWLEFLQARR